MALISPAGWPLPQRRSDRSRSVVLSLCLSAPLWRMSGVSSHGTVSIHQAGRTVKAQKNNQTLSDLTLQEPGITGTFSRHKNNQYILVMIRDDIICTEKITGIEFEVVEIHFETLFIVLTGLTGMQYGAVMVRHWANGLVCDHMQDVPLQIVHPLIRRQETPQCPSKSPYTSIRLHKIS